MSEHPSASADNEQPCHAEMPAPMRNVEGKVAFVTGGDSGIGLGITRALLDAGMKVVITYRTDTHLAEAMTVLGSAGNRLHAIKLDVTDRPVMMAAAAETLHVFGKVHVLISNAGVGPLVPLSAATFDDWDWCMSVNVNGVFNGVRAFLPHIRAHNEGGHIAATSSALGGLIVGPFWGVYSTSKFAVVGMMEALRSELSNTNIGVSVFCPAGVYTKIGRSQRNRPASLAETGADNPETKAMMADFDRRLRGILDNQSEPQPAMDPLEAGKLVLRGIRNNDLYILSHSEYAQAIQERSEALLASIPHDNAPTSGRLALARLVHTPIYANELRRRS